MGSLATGALEPFAGSSAAAFGRGVAVAALAGAFSGAFSVWLVAFSAWAGAFSAAFAGAFAGALAGAWDVAGALVWVWVWVWLRCEDGADGGRPWAGAALPLPKYDAHSGPTLPGSLSYCSFISSTSHSLAPRSDDGATEDWLPDCPFGDCATLVSPLPDLIARGMDQVADKASPTRTQMQGRARPLGHGVAHTDHP